MKKNKLFTLKSNLKSSKNQCHQLDQIVKIVVTPKTCNEGGAHCKEVHLNVNVSPLLVMD